jgi:hypothetical protein
MEQICFGYMSRKKYLVIIKISMKKSKIDGEADPKLLIDAEPQPAKSEDGRGFMEPE